VLRHLRQFSLNHECSVFFKGRQNHPAQGRISSTNLTRLRFRNPASSGARIAKKILRSSLMLTMRMNPT
jgi:hypothetical protein